MQVVGILFFSHLLEIIRTRNPEVLKTLDCLVDVGAVYEPETFVVLDCINFNTCQTPL